LIVFGEEVWLDRELSGMLPSLPIAMAWGKDMLFGFEQVSGS